MMNSLFSTRKRRLWAIVLCTALVIATAMRFGANYLASWQSPQYTAYNLGIELYTVGDHVCTKEEAKDPLNNKCLDIDTTVKIFGASIQSYINQLNNTSPIMDILLPPGSQELAALSSLHQGILLMIKQKPEDAIKALKQAIIIADLEMAVDDTFNVDMLLRPHAALQRAAALVRLAAVKLTAQYDLELTFKKNPSQANKEGKGGHQKGNQPGQADPNQGKPDKDQDPTQSPPGKGNRDNI
jgi:hypothetical protein